MTAQPPKPERVPIVWLSDLLVVAFLIGFDAGARLLPHAPGFMPIAASALFAGRLLRLPILSPVIPIAAMALSSMTMGSDDWRIAFIVYAALALPALAGVLSRRWHGAAAVAAAMLPCSIAFFVLSNFAVWAFSGMYSLDGQGLLECYIAGLPFLKNTIAGDLFWCAVLFGSAWLVQQLPVAARRTP
jgi:Family of unknown function (DUF6580)